MAGARRIALAAGTSALLALGASSVGYTSYALLAPLPAVSAVVMPFEGVATPEPTLSYPAYGASAIGAADSEQLFGGVDVDTVHPMASLAKVVTALVVLDERPIAEGEAGATITLTAADSRLPARYAAINGTVAPAPAGRTVTQRQVIELMMVHSANNYAETLAVWAFGSVDAYLSAARTWLDAHGLGGVTIADTTGFAAENTASARDLLALARLAVADPVVSAASALSSVTVPGIGSYENRNLALGLEGVTGLKTGTLRIIGSNLLFSARLQVEGAPVDVVGVVIGGPEQTTVARDVAALIASVRDDFHPISIGTAGAVVARYTAPWGETAELRIAEGAEDLVWGKVVSVSFVSAPDLQPGLPAPTGATLLVRYGEREVRLPLEWNGAIEAPPIEWRLAQPLETLLAG